MIRKILSLIYRFIKPLDPVEMYKKMGVKIGENCKIQGEVIIDYSHYWHISIGNNVTIAPRVHILAHDASTKFHLGYTKIGKVDIGNNVFIGAGTIILPGVTIGDNSIIGAGSIVHNDILPDTVVAGTPAKTISTLEYFIEKNKTLMDKYPVFEEEYTLRKGITIEMKNEMNKKMKSRYGFVN